MAENAALVAHLLAGHPAVRHVYYPGLRSHPQHELARSQQSGFGGMLSFELHGGIGNVRAFLSGLQCFSLAESLGGVESLVAHPASMTHAAMDAEARRVAGISDTLLRLSIGIEVGRRSHPGSAWRAGACGGRAAASSAVRVAGASPRILLSVLFPRSSGTCVYSVAVSAAGAVTR